MTIYQQQGTGTVHVSRGCALGGQRKGRSRPVITRQSVPEDAARLCGRCGKRTDARKL